MSRRQTSSPSSFTLAALPRAQGGTSRVQRARRPPARRRQLAEPSRHWTRGWSRQQRKLSNQFQGGKEREKKKMKRQKIYVSLLGSFSGGGGGIAQTCSSVLKTIHYIDGGIQKYVAVATNSFS